MIFARVELLLLLLMLPLWWLRASHRKTGLLFARANALQGLPATGRLVAGLATLPRMLRAGALGSLVVVLAGPTVVRTSEVSEREEIAIVLAVDVSSSMLAEDMEEGQTRMATARETAARFVRARTGDRIGLVVFSGEAFTRITPTDDPSVVLAGVEELETGLLRDGTDISSAIIASTNRLLPQPHQTKVIVLLTDGAHNAQGVSPLAAAQAAATHGVKVYAVSILGAATDTASGGEDAEVALRQRTELEREIETVLTQVARVSNGRYYHASQGAELDSIYGEIDRLETTLVGQRQQSETAPAHVWFLLAALALVSCEATVTASRWGAVP